MANKVGRPTIYTPELAKFICDIVATNSCGLKHLCKMFEEFPSKFTINKWRMENAEFSSLFARAKLQQADLLAEQCLEIADDCDNNNYNQARLQIDTRKWLASKLLPKAYGDKYVSDHKQLDEDSEANKEMLKLRAELDAKNRKDY